MLSLSLSIYDAANTSVWYVVFYYCDISLSSFLSFLPCCLWRGFDAFDFSVDEMMILDDDDGSFFSLSLSFNALVSSFCAEKIISQ